MTTTSDQFANFAQSTLAGGAGGLGTPLNPSDTSLILQTGDGSAFSATTSGPFMMLIGNASGSHELVKVGARSGDSCSSLTRGSSLAAPDNTTTSATWPVGTIITQVATAGSFTNLWNTAAGTYNAKYYGAVANGTTDDTTAVQAAITAAGAAGGGVVLLPGVCAISAPLTLSSAKVLLTGVGAGSGLKALAGFSGAEMVSITADYCGVTRMEILGGPNNASASNPSLTAAIEISSARWWRLRDLWCQYVNGWCVEAVGGASVNCSGGIGDGIWMNHCAKGIHTLGNSGSNNVGQQFFSNIHPEAIDNGDAFCIEDVNDVEVVNLNGAVAGGAVTGNMLHILGASATHKISNIDLGQLSQGTASPTILIESGANGNPSDVTVVNGIVQKGSTGITVSAGSDIKFVGLKLKTSNGDGVLVSGAQGPITFAECDFATNNQSGGTAYDVDITISSQFVYLYNCKFQSPVAAATAGSVTNPANDTNHRGYFQGCHFAGSGTTPSTVFAGTPQIVRNCVGYNPRGSISAPSITFGATNNTSQNDVLIVFTAINGMTGFRIGGTSWGVVPVVGAPIHVPARQTVQCDGTGTLPTWLWFAD